MGYLKAAHAFDPAVDAYLAWCLRHSRPAVVLSPDPRLPHLAAIEYRFPSPDISLTDDAAEAIRRWSMSLRAPRLRRPPLITPVGGEITGLIPAGAEELAFRIADATLDDDRTRARPPEDLSGDT